MPVDVRPDQLVNFLIRLIIQNNLVSQRTVIVSIELELDNDVLRKKCTAHAQHSNARKNPVFGPFAGKTRFFVNLTSFRGYDVIFPRTLGVLYHQFARFGVLNSQFAREKRRLFEGWVSVTSV